MEKKIIVIGGGAAGMMAAISAALAGTKVLLLEKTPTLGNKILISGKSRCNITNTTPLEEFIHAYGDNGKWLRNAFHHFFRAELLAFFAKWGVTCKEERGGRVFPNSDNAAAIKNALEGQLGAEKVEVITSCPVRSILTKGGKVSGVTTLDGSFFPSSAVILATGGASYPQTGSSGDGYKMARALGHTIVKLRAALVPLVVEEKTLVRDLQGVSLKNVRLTTFACSQEEIDPSLIPSCDIGRGVKKRAKPPLLESRFGEMLFTHFGIGGPITLSLSLAVNRALARGKVSVSIDLKPALSFAQLSRRIQADLDAHGKMHLINIMMGLVPRKMTEPLTLLMGIAPDKRACDVSARERAVIAATLKSLRFDIVSSLPLTRAIVTAGGVSLTEISPHTMESHLVKGLFLCGEVLDIDADTGGYNLQAAFSTGFVAGKAAAGLENYPNKGRKANRVTGNVS